MSSGSVSSAAPPATSAIAPRSDVITGVPSIIASAIGSPKPSARLGKSSARGIADEGVEGRAVLIGQADDVRHRVEPGSEGRIADRAGEDERMGAADPRMRLRKTARIPARLDGAAEEM